MTTPDPVALREALAQIDIWRQGLQRVNPHDQTVLVAARWALDLIEGGTEVWWCEPHRGLGDEGSCFVGGSRFCRMVKRLLVAL